LISSGAMKNIFLVSIDTFRFDCIGYQPDKKELKYYDVLKYLETPALDHLAGKSLCYTHCFSTNTYTTSAHASVFTGLYPPGHGVREFYRKRLDKSVYGLAEILKVYGYRTVMFTDMVHLFEPLELNRGFDFLITKDDASLFKLLSDFRNDEKTKNFIFIHFFDLHAPYLTSENEQYNDEQFLPAMEELYAMFSIPFERSIYSSRDKYFVWQNFMHQTDRDISALLPLYIRGIRKFDTGRFRDFLSLLKSYGYMDDSLFFFFSDHGEGRNDDKIACSFGHSGPVYDNVIRVPLMVYHRDISHGVTDKMASIVDIFPTILEAATGEKPDRTLPYAIDGVNLLQDNQERTIYSETWLNDHKDKHWNLEMTSYLLYQRALRNRSRKYLIYGRPEKFTEGNYEGSDQDFLRDYYRCYRSEFESYEKFMDDLAMLKSNPSARADMLRMGDERSFCYFDLAKDPDEVSPVFVKNALKLGSDPHFETILSISNRSSKALSIFDEISHKFLEDIAEKLFISNENATIRFLSQNKHLLNEMIDRLILDPAVSDKEFIKLIYAIFLRRTPKETEMAEGEKLFHQGVTRRLYFNNEIFNNKVFGDLRISQGDKTNWYDLLELAEYKHKYDEVQESLIFRFFSKTASIVDNVIFPPLTRRRTLLLYVLKRVRKTG
jgi:arylsulfatase A-like enzyme